MSGLLMLRDVTQLAGYLERRMRETDELIATAAGETEVRMLNAYYNGLAEALQAARQVESYNPAAWQPGLGLEVDAPPLPGFSLPGF